MSPVPILDDAYMERVYAMQRSRAWSEAMRQSWATMYRPLPKADPVDEARELYATGAIDFAAFSARIDVALKGPSC